MAGAGLALAPNMSQANFWATDRPAMAEYMGGFSAPKLETVRFAFIGVGARGSGHAKQIAAIEGTEVVAISDLYEDLANKSAEACKTAGKGERHKKIKLYTDGENDWKKMLQEQKPDAVIIATPWKLHAPMAIEAMKAGTHAFVEVPLALTLEEMWQLVDTSEKTEKHCMMMENVNYGREELLYLNMCRQGVIGELLHGEAAYIHELRGQMNEVERGTGSWRTYHYADRNGNLYPTHGLGPVAQYMNVGRGDDNFKFLNAFSSPAKGRQLYAEKNYTEDHQWNKLDFPEPYGNEIITAFLGEMEIGFNRNLLWTTLFQYVDQNEFIGINSRLQWRFSPMSDIFLVYIDNYDVLNGLANINSIQSNNRALVLKVNYWY